MAGPIPQPIRTSGNQSSGGGGGDFWNPPQGTSRWDILTGNTPNPAAPGPADFASAAHAGPSGGSYQQINGAWYYVSNRTGFKQPVAGVTVQPINGANYYVAGDGTILGTYTAPANTGSPISYGGGGGGGMTAYEAAQIALDNQRLADAEKTAQQNKLTQESTAVENFNKDFRDFQLKSPYGAQYGPTYFSPAGSVFAQRAPESPLLKNAFSDLGQTDPWSQTGNVPAGYTGVTYSNPQHPGLVDFGQPTVQQNYAQPASPSQTAQPDLQSQWMQWHDLAHQLQQPQQAGGPATQSQGQPQPVQLGGASTVLPRFASGGTVPGPSGSPQLIVAEGGETVTPTQSSTPDQQQNPNWNQLFNQWHDMVHASPSTPWTGASTPIGADVGASPLQNPYGQTVPQNVRHGLGEDITPGAMGFNPSSNQFLNNHVQYSPTLTGMSGTGGLITPNGTPVVMSAWQRANLDPSSIANYNDYAQSIAGWSPTDLQHYTERIMGGSNSLNSALGDLGVPKTWAPITIQPAPAGG